jgi:hypothetical protein
MTIVIESDLRKKKPCNKLNIAKDVEMLFDNVS